MERWTVCFGLITAPADARGKRLPMEHIQGVAQCLDRLTVQLFNSQESTLLLAKEHGLLDTLMNLLSEATARPRPYIHLVWRLRELFCGVSRN